MKYLINKNMYPEEAIINYFYILDEESKRVTDISEDSEVQNELFNLFQRAYPFPLDDILPDKRRRLLRGISRSRWNYVTKQIIMRANQLDILDAGSRVCFLR